MKTSALMAAIIILFPRIPHDVVRINNMATQQNRC